MTLRGKKILSIYYKHKPGGFCKRLIMMLTALANAGGEVHYIAVEPYPIWHPRIVPHILWTPFARKEGILFWAYFISIVPFYSFFVGVRLRVDIVSVFGGLYSFLAAPLKLRKTPIVTFARSDVHEINRLQERFLPFIFLEDMLGGMGFKLSDRIVAVNDSLKEVLSSRYGICSRVAVLKNHIQHVPTDLLVKESCRRQLGFGSGDFIVVTMAVLNSGKNIEVLIKAGRLLRMPTIILIVGDGPERSKLERLASLTEGPTKVIFTGWQNRVSNYLSAADLFVFPSKHEGCSNALLEALAHGVPCLGSRIPQNREILCSEDLLFDPDDSEALAQMISRMFADGAFRAEIKALSEQSAKPFTFDWDHAVVAIHEEILSLKSGKMGVGAASIS